MTFEAVVVPLKRFDRAKDRLRIDAGLDVASLAKELARGVILSSRPRHVIVLSEHPTVSKFALSLDAEVRQSSASTLNEAVQSAYQDLQDRFERLIITHGDLLHPEGLGDFEPATGITLVADHRGLGTNVLVVPTGLDFRFAYGAQSLHRHALEAQRLEVTYRIVLDSPWRFDVDEPSDLNAP